MKSSRDKSQPRWTLMFIGDHGKVIELKHIRWLIAGTMVLLAAAIISAVILFVFNQKLSYANKNLRRSLETTQARMTKVRQQTDMLMAQVALAEAKAKDATPETTPVEGGTAETVTESQQVVTPEPQATTPTPAAVSKPPEPRPAPEPVAKPKPQKPVPEPVVVEGTQDLVLVEIDNLVLSRPEGAGGTLNLEFKLRNVSPQPHRIEGRVIAILKGDDLLPDEWLTIPKVRLVDGKPSEKRGHRFAINNWRTMRMKTSYSGTLGRYNLAEIFVYSSDGEVLLREVHPVNSQ